MFTRNNRLFIAAWLLFWALMITVQLQDYVRSGGREYWQPVLWETSSAIIATLMMLTQRRMMRRFDYLLASPSQWFGLQMIWLPLYWIFFTPIVYAIRHAVYEMMGEHYLHQPWTLVFLDESVRLSLFFSIFVVILFGILSYRALLREKEQALVSNNLMREMQLHRLTQQIQPHFLFNALNTISQLMHVDVERADATLVQLGDVLRATLEVSERHETTVDKEVQLVKAYARLMCERFGERVEIAWHIDSRSHNCMLPVMSIQLLLENIFKHTVEQRRQRACITVTTFCNEGKLLIRLDDDIGMITTGESRGIGLKNLRARLQALHGEHASLNLTQLMPAGVRAEMSLPCAC
jgi:two-component system LytT family sensor kinase